MDDENCILCSESIHKGESVIVKRGLQTLIVSSKKRGDAVWQKVANFSEIKVHVKCRRIYTNPTQISSLKHKTSINGQAIEDGITSKTSTIRSGLRFSYKTKCLFCTEEVVFPNPKLPKNRRRLFNRVETVEIAESILAKCEERNDELGEAVKYRVMYVNLIAEEAQYHTDCYANFRHIKKYDKDGRPSVEKYDAVLQLLFNHIENNDECQYTFPELKDLINKLSDEKHVVSDYILKNRLKKHFEDTVIITEAMGSRPAVITFTETAHSILHDEWYSQRKKNMENERLRVVEMAAEIIRQDIRGAPIDLSNYPSIDDMGDGGTNIIPQSLNVLINNIVQGRGKKGADKTRSVTTICHSVMSASRPRSFLSPLQLGLSVHLHSKYGSRHLIDLLHSISLCASYNETVAYLNAANDIIQPEVTENAFAQFVFDNADVNTRTIDGHGTIHILGGIQCVTPANAILTSPPLLRDNKKRINLNLNSIPLCHYKKSSRLGLQSLQIKSIDVSSVDVDVIRNGLKLNLHWIAGFLSSTKCLPFWNGYMQEAMNKTGSYHTSKIIPMPFINLDASNMTTINSALTYAASECKKRNTCCIVTFDQPLFIKACEIVEGAENHSILSSVIVRLGGFHLLMSFLGCIGSIMKGSGIEELWGTVYAKATIPHLMSGHAFSRSLRANLLTVVALFKCLIDKSPNLSNQVDSLIANSEKLITNEMSPNEIYTSESVSYLLEQFLVNCRNKSEGSRTAKLWIQYLNMVILVMQFIKAERTGDFDLHLNTVISMLPFFHAAGHHLYAKSAHLYVQKMMDLPQKMKKEEFERFSRDGYFSIRRSARNWSGIWTDMVIEQSLMRPMKSIGGLTHGRGITQNTLLRWTSSIPLCTEITRAIERFCGKSLKTSEQHTEENPARRNRDSNDQKVFCNWLMEHNPFFHESGELVSLSSGLVGDASVTCDKAKDLGEQSMREMIGNNFGSITIKRKFKVKSLATVNSAIKLGDDTVIVNTQQLFNRIICVENDPVKLKECFKFELAARPPSLFDEVSLRKGNKSSLVKAFVPEESINIPDDCVFIIDGGHLLHSVKWPRPATYGDVMNCYISYVNYHFKDRCVVVFDGYPDQATIKCCEQQRRAARRTSTTIQPQDNNFTTTTQAEFLSNNRNKKCFIEMLADRCLKHNIKVRLAVSDADSLIVSTALEEAKKGETVVVVGKDTDLLVLLTSFASVTDKVMFLRPAGSKKKESLFNISRQQTALGDIGEILLFVHAVTGCDTTSAIFKKGKLNALKLVQKDRPLMEDMHIFTKQGATKAELFAAGEKFLIRLYSGSTSTTLDDLRYFRYNHIVSRQPLNKVFNLASLPPTSDAAAQHSYRVYLQVQEWKGNKMEASDWGWSNTGRTLSPVFMTKSPAPSELLTLISCNCKSNCNNKCQCRKSMLQCSAMCRHCQGLSCRNSGQAVELHSDDE